MSDKLTRSYIRYTDETVVFTEKMIFGGNMKIK